MPSQSAMPALNAPYLTPNSPFQQIPHMQMMNMHPQPSQYHQDPRTQPQNPMYHTPYSYMPSNLMQINSSIRR